MNSSYEQAVQRLFDLQRFGIKLGLENIGRLLSRLGDPRPGRQTVIIGGTNGKGSVSAMLASIGRAAGLRTGLFTSPHLTSFTERIQIDGRRITRQEVTAAAARLWEALEPFRRSGEPEPITFFEMLTAMAADYFHRNGVELAVMEVGLGGRLDATNALPRDLVILTDISIDHVEYLGHTVARIVDEKAALFRPGVPAIAAGGLENAGELIVAQAAKAGCPLTLLGRDFTYRVADGRLSLRCGGEEIADLVVPLKGSHQYRNAAIAVCAARQLGITDPATIRAGLAATVWPGRLEAFPGRPSWLLDAAHNPGGAAVLASALVGEPRPDVWLMTCLGDKDIAGVVERIAPLVGKVICTTLPMDRAISPEKLAAIVRPFNSEVHLAADPDEGMALAQRLAGPDGRILVAGSIYLLGHVRGKLTGETGP
ncbi:MAG: bifunctional folylpolyglutamate synthase/dihydrofolate synthase [Myxococcales bacterium]|nr:bifunctional folylpolyglutamate synthase/dihydrofolate synthase [Myxococcales bacterium]